MAMSRAVILSSVLIGSTEATGMTTALSMNANPIRRVVTMLQNIQKKVEKEGEQAEELFDKFMCACKTQTADMEAQISAAETKASDVAAGVEGAAGQKTQLEADIKKAKADLAAAKEAMSTATALREKENGEFNTEKAETEANIGAMKKALAAMEGGASAAFLQTNNANKLRNIVAGVEMPDADRDTMIAFLQGKSSEEGNEVTGILKQMLDEMSKGLSESSAAESEAVANYDQLIAAKTKEAEALQLSIEEKMARLGKLGVSLAEMKNDGGDNAGSLEDTKKLLVDLKKECAAREAGWDEEQKARQAEQVALADTIKMLNDDEALDLFKKTLPSAASSFMQVTATASSMKAQALQTIHAARKGKHMPKLDFIALALHGKKVGFDKVIKMIDDMITVLKTEQAEDDKKKDYCTAEFDQAEDQKKSLERTVSDAEKAISDAKETVIGLKDEMKAISDSLKEMDKSVKEATEQRKEENGAYKTLMAENAAAKELIGKAKKRLNKFYNPKLAFVQTSHQKKGEEANGVMALMDTLVADLDKEMTIAETEEKDAQGDYEKAMEDAKQKRADDSKTLEDKEAAVADAEAALQTNKGAKSSAQKELQGTLDYITSLHHDCDFLMQYYDQRKEARTDETEALGKAKDVLNGADYSFLQLAQRKHLRGRF